MIRKKINAASEWCEDHLRRMCGAMSPDKRLIVVLTMLVLFSALSFYITFTAFYHIGKGAGEQLQIEHIEHLELELQRKQTELDSVKQINDFNYEYERATE